MEFKIFNIDTTGRKFGLDLLRALAIVLVLISHSKTILAPFKIDLSFLSIGGFYGVELFFVLSGFLIGTILIKTFLKEGFDLLSIKDFWKRRWYRTLPNYYLVLILNIILTFFLRESWDFFDWKFFVFAQNLFTPFVLKIQRYILRPSSIQESLVVYTGFWVITILLSTLLYKFYEKPFTDLRDRKDTSGTIGF